jgi:hypothetical protein
VIFVFSFLVGVLCFLVKTLFFAKKPTSIKTASIKTTLIEKPELGFVTTYRGGVRRLIFSIQKRIRSACSQLAFEPHDAILREKFVTLSNNILLEVGSRGYINDFYIKCDDEINTPDMMARNEMRAIVGVRPTIESEFILIEFLIKANFEFSVKQSLS